MLLILFIIFIAIIAGIVAISKKDEEYKKKKYGEEQYEQMQAETLRRNMELIRIHNERKEYKRQKKMARKDAIVGALIAEDILSRIGNK